MPYCVVLNHRHQNNNRTIVLATMQHLQIIASALPSHKIRCVTDTVTGAIKLQIADEPLYTVFNALECVGWALVGGFSSGNAAEEYVFHVPRDEPYEERRKVPQAGEDEGKAGEEARGEAEKSGDGNG